VGCERFTLLSLLRSFKSEATTEWTVNYAVFRCILPWNHVLLFIVQYIKLARYISARTATEMDGTLHTDL
jgi:hypothetical protein